MINEDEVRTTKYERNKLENADKDRRDHDIRMASIQLASIVEQPMVDRAVRRPLSLALIMPDERRYPIVECLRILRQCRPFVQSSSRFALTVDHSRREWEQISKVIDAFLHKWSLSIRLVWNGYCDIIRIYVSVQIIEKCIQLLQMLFNKRVNDVIVLSSVYRWYVLVLFNLI